MTRLLRHIKARGGLVDEINRLRSWYQPVDFGYGLRTPATDKTGASFRKSSLDRGIAKWREFIEPNLPFSLKGKRVLDIGCNAGLFINEVAQRGAREVVGVEKDDHYFEQAQFVAKTFSKLHDRRYPVRIYQGPMEDFNYEGLGYFDLALMLLVIYHIGKTEEYSHLSRDQVTELQVNTIKRVSTISRYILFQGNPLEDGGRGKGIGSLKALVEGAGLSIVNETSYDHARGYILLTESPRYNPYKTFPISRMINKYFLPANKSAEREVADLYSQKGRNGFDVAQTKYYKLRTAQTNWNDEAVAHPPKGLEREPVYWVVPWSLKERTIADNETQQRKRGFDAVLQDTLKVFDSIFEKGFNHGSTPIPGFELVHPELGSVFQYIDGNRRMGALSNYADRHCDGEMEIPVVARQTIHRDKLLSYPLAKQLVNEGRFTESDVYKWFDNAFWFLSSAEK